MSGFSDVLQSRLDAFRTLGVQPTIALRLVELGRDSAAELEHYLDVLRLSRSLSAKLLAVANSTWFATRVPITTLKRALARIGLVHVQALAISPASL